MTTSALLAVQAQVYATINVAAVTSLAPVYDEVPPGKAFPYIEIGEFEETKDNAFGHRRRSVLASLHIFSEYAGYKESEAIIEQLNILLDDTPLPNPVGWVTITNDMEIVTAHKEFDVVELRHVIARYRIFVEEP